MNKWIEGLKAGAGTIAAVAAAVAIGYGVIVKAGFVISRAEAQTMIDLKATDVLARVAQAVTEEEQARKESDLEFQQDLALQRLEYLLSLEERSEVQEIEIEQIKKKLERISQKLDDTA